MQLITQSDEEAKGPTEKPDPNVTANCSLRKEF